MDASPPRPAGRDPLDVFLARWEAGDRVSVEAFLREWPDLAGRADEVAALVGAEVEALRARGEAPTLADYLARFPAQTDAVRRAFAAAVPGPSPPTTDTQGWAGRPADPAHPFLGPPGPAGELGRLGDVRVLRVLGEGGMGVVFEAEEPRPCRRVAVKVLKPALAADPEARARFVREANALARVEHDRVVPVYRVGEAGGVPYLVMPLLAGESLEMFLRRDPRPPAGVVARVGREVAEGLAAVHAAGLVHRDVKPSNVWLKAPAGSAVLLDFGLARETWGAGVTAVGGFLGTPEYTSPEQVDGRPVDGRADLFGLGCVLYRMAAGRPPFTGDTLTAVLRAVAEHHPPPLHDVDPSVPRPLSDLVARLLAKSPDDRPASAQAVVDELRTPEAAVSTRPGRTAVGPSPGGRRRWRWAAVGAGVVAVAAALLVPPLLAPAGGRESTDGGGAAPTAPLPGPADPLRVTALEVEHYATRPGGAGGLVGVLGRESFRPVLGDAVKVRARLSRPAHAYILACRADGVVDLCFPESEEVPPPLTAEPCYPWAKRGGGYGLEEGTGLWVFAVVAVDRPTAYRDWLAGRAVPWRPGPAPEGTVWFDDGVWVEAVGPGGTVRGDRAKDKSLPGQAEVVRVTDWLKEHGSAAATGFVVVRP
jgi:hypothetical protein